MNSVDLSRGRVIGEPEVIEGYFIINVKCTCGTSTLLIGMPGPGSARPCANSKCEKMYAIGAPPELSPLDGQLHWKIAHGHRNPVVAP